MLYIFMVFEFYFRVKLEIIYEIDLLKKFIFGQFLESQGTHHNSFINVSDVCYIRYATFSHQRHRRLRSVIFEFFFSDLKYFSKECLIHIRWR